MLDINYGRKYIFYVDACTEYVCSNYTLTRTTPLVTFDVSAIPYTPPIYPSFTQVLANEIVLS